MDFLICYEHNVREVENDTLLKYELEKRGYSCKIIHFNDMDYSRYTGRHKAKVVVTPWLRYDENVFHYLQIAQKPYKLVNLQWEQVYSEHGLQSGVVRTVGNALKAYHICWGENSRNRLIAAGISPDNLKITGAMQMDYGRPLFDEYYQDRESLAAQFDLDSDKKWNLLISSFSYANYGDEDISMLEKKFNTSLTELVNINRQSQRLTLDWVEKLLSVSDCEFIYRPHPSENLDTRLQQMAEKYPRFHVISSLSVKQWARVCDKVNLWISTSNAELLAMNIGYAIVRPIEIPYEYEVESMRSEQFVTDADSFVRFNMSYDHAAGNDCDERMGRIAHYYSYVKDYPAYKRVADYLESVLNSPEGQRFDFALKQKVSFQKRELKQRIFSSIVKKCYVAGNMAPAARMPWKPESQKYYQESIKSRIDKHCVKEAMEKRMLEYLKAHDVQEK